MIKRHVLCLNFSDKEHLVIAQKLAKVNADVILQKASLNEVTNEDNGLSKANLILLMLSNNIEESKTLLKQVKKQF
ncbi:MAG: hypothetical protein KBT50_02150, partial [Cycloclasticus sp.]|nr:hypothetical protein [Cycloclasticus sp.]MBQ0789392.1 hypothetical protein [Cycloclasticus sp.]